MKVYFSVDIYAVNASLTHASGKKHNVRRGKNVTSFKHNMK